jgi:hypothetical protein
MLFPTIQLHNKKEKKIECLASRIMLFLVISVLHLPPSPFSNALAKLAISTNHEECQTTFIKPIVLRLPETNAHDKASSLINLQQKHKENSHIHKTKNNFIN